MHGIAAHVATEADLAVDRRRDIRALLDAGIRSVSVAPPLIGRTKLAIARAGDPEP